MLIPYYLFLKPEWRDTLSLNLFKILLVFASVVGFLLPIAPKIILKSYKKFDEVCSHYFFDNIGTGKDIVWTDEDKNNLKTEFSKAAQLFQLYSEQ